MGSDTWVERWCRSPLTLEEVMQEELEGQPVDIFKRDPLLQQRQSTHGSFDMNAITSQRLKDVLKKVHPHYENLCAEHKEALDMICLKMSRIMSGQATYRDHWDDIAGYAKLGSEACE